MEEYWRGKYDALRARDRGRDRDKDLMIYISWSITFIAVIGLCLAVYVK